MEDSTEGLSLPQFSGRLSADWGTHEQRLRSWLSVHGIPLHAHEAAETLSLSLTAQAALAFEHDSGGTERYTFETAAEWCRGRWGGRDRQRLAVAAAVNALNARSFREQGRRPEDVKDLVNDLELLLLQAGVIDDEGQRRAFISCFFEFPHCLARLSQASSYAAAVAEAVAWEADMVRKEREALASRVKASSTVHLSAPHHPTTEPDYAGLEPPRHPAPHEDSPVETRFVDDGHNRREGVPGATSQQRPVPYLRPYPSRSTEMLNISLHSVERDGRGDGPRAQTSLAVYPSNEREDELRPPTAHTGQRHYPLVPTTNGGTATLAVPSPRPSSSASRTPTPPFVTSATSFRSSYTSADAEVHVELYDAFPYPARPSPTGGSFTTFRAAPRPPRGVGEQLWRSTSPLRSSSVAAEEKGRGKTLGRTSKLAKPFQRSVQRRSKSVGGAGDLFAQPPEQTEERMMPEIGRPAKPRGKLVRTGLGLPP